METKTKARRRARALISQALALFAVYFVVRYLVDNWAQLSTSLRQVRPVYLLIAAVPTLAMLLLVSWGWTLVMRWVGVSLSGWAGFQIYYRSSVYRYLPGSFWYLPGRAFLCQERGIPLSSFASAAILELSSILATATVLGGWAVSRRFDAVCPLVVALAVGGCIGAGLLFPRRLRRLILRRQDGEGAKWTTLMGVIFLYMGAWAMYGLSINLLLFAFDAHSEGFLKDWGYVISASSAAWIAGFLSFVPTGLGVREASLMGLLQLVVSDFDQIALFSLVQRMMEMLLEVCLWIFASLIRKKGA